MHKRLKAFEKKAIEGRWTGIDAAAILLTAAAATSVYVWWDRLSKLLRRCKPAASSTGCPRTP